MAAIDKYEEAMANAPARGAGLHQEIMRIACLGVLAEIPPELIIQDCNSKLAGIKNNEAKEAVKKAMATVTKEEYIPPTPIKNKYKPKQVDQFRKFITGQSGEIMDLVEQSQIRLLGDYEKDGYLVLETLYRDDEYLFIGDVFDRDVLTVREWLGRDLTKFPHIIPNPMTGEAGMTGDAKISYRCETTVGDLRYAVCEMDEVCIGDQVAFWMKCIKIGIPVAAVIHSGKKSLHGWIKVDCGLDTKRWEVDVRGWLFNDFGVKYGLDKACSNKARLSRLPGHERGKGQTQRLLYLNGDV